MSAATPTTAIVLFTRDLRVHDHPALHAAWTSADRVVPLFVLDDAILQGADAAPNRLAFLHDSLGDLHASLRDRGAGLVVRRGDPATVVGRLAAEVGGAAVHLSDDVSALASRRLAALRRAGTTDGFEVHAHPGVTAVPIGEVRPSGVGPRGRSGVGPRGRSGAGPRGRSGGDAYQVFSPYLRAWRAATKRAVLPAPTRLTLPADLEVGGLPPKTTFVGGTLSPQLQVGGETAARARLDAWLAGPIAAYDTRRDVLGDDGTSKLSADLHLGCLSALEVTDRLDLRRSGHDVFQAQVVWREFNHQLLAARPTIPTSDIRPRGDRWRDDDQAFTAWRDGLTGYPVVDAAMRQLLAEGWMHNRARMIVASFLTKHLYLDWRRGARHFSRWLADGDVANNAGQWQWVAGTGTDSRPNRMFNPVTQSKRYDPDGTYIRRYVPELADLDARDIHAPWESLAGSSADYPPPIVDHAEARARFLAARGVG